MIDWLIDWLIHWLTRWILIDKQLIDWLGGWCSSRLIDKWLIDSLKVAWSIDWLIWLIDPGIQSSLINWSIELFLDTWLIHWLIEIGLNLVIYSKNCVSKSEPKLIKFEWSSFSHCLCTNRMTYGSFWWWIVQKWSCGQINIWAGK